MFESNMEEAESVIERRKRGKAWLWFQGGGSGWQVTSFDPREDAAIGFKGEHKTYINEEYVLKLEAELKIATDALGFYSDRKNFQLIFDNEEDSRAEVYEKYKANSIGDFSFKAIEALNALNKP